MTTVNRSIRLIANSSTLLDKKTAEVGEIFYDNTNQTIRIMDGSLRGGRALASQAWVNDNTISQIDVDNALIPYVTETELTETLTSYTDTVGMNSAISTAISGLLDAAPPALDTLNELAAALNDDANYASTITTALSAKAPLADPTFTGTSSNTNLSYTGTLTGGTSVIAIGTNQIYKDALGNVGIGTSSPASKLAIGSGNLNFSGTSQRITGDMSNATITNRLAFQTSTANANTTLTILPNGTSVASGIVLEGDSAQTNGSFFAVTLTAGGEARITSGIRGTGTYLPITMLTGGSERLRINTSGKVSIGTTSPISTSSTLLTVGGTNLQAGIEFISSTLPTINSSISGLGWYANDGTTNALAGTINIRAAEDWSATNHGSIIQFRNVASGSGGALFESMRIDSSGNVGIGTSSPVATLNVSSSTTLAGGSPSIVLQGSSNTERIAVRSSGAGSGTSVVVVQSSRGTPTSPLAALSGDALGYYQFGAHNGNGWTRSAWITGIADGDYSLTSYGSILAFSTTPSGSTVIAERMRIDSSGNVGIGNTPSGTYKLEVTGLVSDGIGNVRSAPRNAQTSAYTLVALDNGKHISITTGGVIVPSSIMSIGDMVTIYNNSAASQTITTSAVTCFLAGTATTGSRTLAQRGLATLLCVDTNVFVISGAGLT